MRDTAHQQLQHIYKKALSDKLKEQVLKLDPAIKSNEEVLSSDASQP